MSDADDAEPMTRDLSAARDDVPGRAVARRAGRRRHLPFRGRLHQRRRYPPSAWLDIAADGLNKPAAMERVRIDLGIPPERVMAVADGRNNIGLLRWLSRRGRRVAMGDSPADVIEAASELTGTVHDDGLAQVLATL
jgi:hydroxymethylpyrimidine pyrophosphatase-like HAD family hydrolase